MLINKLDTLPDDLPIPIDDGAASHLTGSVLPAIALPATYGSRVTLATLSGRSVVFVYPRTGRPGVPALTDEWNDIPGARGCTPQTCGYRDLADAFGRLSCRVFGLSTQDTDYQREMAERLAVPFPILSDAKLELTRRLKLPTMEIAGHVLLARMTWIIDGGRITKVFYPVFPPNEDAANVLAWVKASSVQGEQRGR